MPKEKKQQDYQKKKGELIYLKKTRLTTIKRK